MQVWTARDAGERRDAGRENAIGRMPGWRGRRVIRRGTGGMTMASCRRREDEDLWEQDDCRRDLDERRAERKMEMEHGDGDANWQ